MAITQQRIRDLLQAGEAYREGLRRLIGIVDSEGKRALETGDWRGSLEMVKLQAVEGLLLPQAPSGLADPAEALAREGERLRLTWARNRREGERLRRKRGGPSEPPSGPSGPSTPSPSLASFHASLASDDEDLDEGAFSPSGE